MFRRILLVFLLVMGISFAATAVTECMKIDTPGYYYMSGDIINNTASPCIQFTTDNVVFDCDYHYLEARHGAIYGAFPGTPTNITIANCSIYSADDCQIAFKGYGRDFHFLNLELNGSRPSLLFFANDSTVYNLSSNSSQAIYMETMRNMAIENITGTGPNPVQIYADRLVDYSIKDLHRVEILLDGCSNGIVENLYSPDPRSGYGYYIAESFGTSRNNTLRNAYISGCDDGWPTACAAFDKFVENVYFYDVELIEPADFRILSNSTYESLSLVDTLTGLDFYGLNLVQIDDLYLNISPAVTYIDGLYFYADTSSNIAVNDALIIYATTKPGNGVVLQAPGASPYPVMDNVALSNIAIENPMVGVEIQDGAKGFDIDGLAISSPLDKGISIIYSGFTSQCDPFQPLNDVTSHHFFDDVEVTDAPIGLYMEDDICDIHFSGLQITAEDAGFHMEPGPGGGDQGSSYISLDNFAINVSDASGVGINLSKNVHSNFTNGEVSGGAYCIWTYRARVNNTYDNLILHDCDTGFLLSNGIIPPGGDFVNTTGVHIYDVLLDYDISDFWYAILFEDTYFGDNSGGIGLEFLTYGCINLENVAQPAPLPAGYNEFHGNYLEVIEFDSTPSCTAPTHYGFMNQTSFLWTAAQQAGYDMSMLKVLRWNGSEWIELPSRLNLTDRSIEVGDMDNFSIFTLTADVAEGGNGGTGDKGDITLIVPAEAYVLDPALIQTFDDHGDPLNAKVSVTLGGETIFYGFVGADGEVEVTPLEQGNYTVTAAKDNYDSPPAAYFAALLRDLEADVPESVGENEQFEILVTSEGVLLEGARAEIDNLVRVTGADGTTTFTLSSAGNYGVEVTKAGYETWSGTVNVWAEGEEPEKEEEAEEEGIIIVDEEVEEETIHPPIVQGEVPSVESPQQPVNGVQTELQQHWLWLILLLLVVLAAVIYWLIKNREKK